MGRFFIAGSLLAAAVAFAIALGWRVPRSASLLDRVAAPAVSDRRSFGLDVTHIDGGIATISGTVPGVKALDAMRWYVLGGVIQPESLRLSGNRFQAKIRLPGYRDAYPIFAYGFERGHAVAMRDEVILRPPDAVTLIPTPELARQHLDRSIDARANIDQARDGGTVNSFASGDTEIHLHDSARVRLVGWALDAARRIAAPRVEAVIDGKAAVATVPEASRTDVAAFYHNPSYTRSGFSLSIPSTLFQTGKHDVELRVVEGIRYNVAVRITIDFSAM